MAKSKAQAEFESELRFHRIEWRIQHAGWALIAAFLLLALAGLFGGGPLSRARAGSEGGTVEYERFVRSGSSTTVVVTPAATPAHGVSRVAISADYLREFRVERITPEPRSARLSGEQLIYEFATAAPGASISFYLQPERLGAHSAELAIDAGAPLIIRQYTYP